MVICFVAERHIHIYIYIYCDIENKHIFIETVLVNVMRKLKDEAIDCTLWRTQV